MKQMRAFIVLMTLVFVGCFSSEPRVTYKGGTAHFPLLDSRVLRYESTAKGESKEYTMELNYLGGHMRKLFPIKFDGIDMGNCEFQSEDTVLYFETNKPRTNLESTAELVLFTEIWIREGVEKGQTWENPETGTLTLFAGYEDVTVAAGAFHNCYKTVTESMPVLFDSLTARHNRGEIKDKEYAVKLADAKKTIARWFASGTGLVKEEINNGEQVRELLAVEKPGSGIIDTTRVESRTINVQPQ